MGWPIRLPVVAIGAAVLMSAVALANHPGEGLDAAMADRERYFEAIDAATTVVGRMDKSRKLNPASPWGPFLCGNLTNSSGAMFRYLEQRGRGLQGVYSPWSTSDSTVFRRGVC